MFTRMTADTLPHRSGFNATTAAAFSLQPDWGY